MKKLQLCLLFIPVAFLCACALACGNGELTILSYNVDNLFDAVADGTEYKEYDPEQGGWTETLYQKKLGQIAGAIRLSVDGGPDVLLLQEIENTRVLEGLLKTGLAGLGYAYSVAAEGSGSATTVGILSRLPIKRTASYMLPPWHGEPLREILEVTLEADVETIVIFNNHWKSKTGGAEQTEEARREAARLVGNRVREFRRSMPDASIIVAGDLNECHDEYDRIGRKYLTALLPWEESGVAPDSISPLFLTSSPDEAGVFGDTVRFFDPWFIVKAGPAGSYYYRGHWESIDHILYMPGKTAYSLKAFRAVDDPRLIDPKTHGPLPWEPKTPERGYSDHLPVLFVLERK